MYFIFYIIVFQLEQYLFMRLHRLSFNKEKLGFWFVYMANMLESDVIDRESCFYISWSP